MIASSAIEAAARVCSATDASVQGYFVYNRCEFDSIKLSNCKLSNVSKSLTQVLWRVLCRVLSPQLPAELSRQFSAHPAPRQPVRCSDALIESPERGFNDLCCCFKSPADLTRALPGRLDSQCGVQSISPISVCLYVRIITHFNQLRARLVAFLRFVPLWLSWRWFTHWFTHCGDPPECFKSLQVYKSARSAFYSLLLSSSLKFGPSS